jgi:acyl-CoA reductase-like NAD-dependent aldehyde dehydrogenase
MNQPSPAAPDTIRVISPATGELLAELPDEGEAGIVAAMTAARAAAGQWAARSLSDRAEALKKWRDAVLDEPEVARTLVRESGKPRHEAEGFEVLYLCELIRFSIRAARRALREETQNHFVVEAPLGGWKASGLGVRHGVEGIRQWTRTEAITVHRPLLAPLERIIARKLAFPYDPRVLSLMSRGMRLLYRRGFRARFRRP